MVPELRFKGFHDDWVQRKLSNLAKFGKGTGFSKSDLTEAGSPIILYGSMYTNYRTVIDRATTYVDPESEGLESTGGEVIVPASGETALDISRASVVTRSGILLGGDLNVIYPDKNVDPEFLALTVSNGRQKAEMVKRAQGGSIVHLHNGDLKQITLTYPSLTEQRKISGLVSCCDSILTLQQEKLDLLKQLKRGYLQKLFPVGSAKQPELRFADFDGDWVQHKLGDVADFINGRAYKQDELLDSGKYPVLRVGNFNTNDQWYYSDLELPVKNYADKGDLLYTWATAFGPHIWQGPRVIYHYHIWKVELSNLITKDFAVQILQADQSQMTNSLNGSTMVHITKATMEGKVIALPSVDEQNCISRFLTNLDDTIALQQHKLDALTQLKQAYLQKLFV
ncbi:type I restriction enzyme specificity protein [Lacticaseibacillus nasuensis JCM 17158]|uniref:Type I restriction enzyme specificity protein n=2 Tax=Lacticaseibacillus TaxID=2759736 RepID=A0A0R1JNG2_9LACO|nr:type I restriction enzyme specificity protein [Lacticaseibacillus nasuensis JCM 17158]